MSGSRSPSLKPPSDRTRTSTRACRADGHPAGRRDHRPAPSIRPPFRPARPDAEEVQGLVPEEIGDDLHGAANELLEAGVADRQLVKPNEAASAILAP